jgi:glycosyltransferase involved in cell wall biosynthesis
LKVLYDHQIFGRQEYGGISRYFCEIADHLPSEIYRNIIVQYSDNVYLRRQKSGSEVKDLFDPRFEFLSGIEFKGKGRLFQIAKKITPHKYLDAETLNKNLTIEYLIKQDFDVFHPTYYDDYFLNYIGNKPFVLTIHDMNQELFPEFYSSKEILEFIKTKAILANKASHIIAVSENTKKDIIGVLGIDEKKISVIYHAVSFKDKEAKGTIELPEKYLLYVGDRAAEYKNFKFMARALAPLLIENKDLFVLCTGREFDNNENNLFQHLGLKGRFLAKFVPENFFFDYYKRALAMVFPSYAEGFGFPVLEAFHCKCPVILANASCFPEIAKDAALYFEPKSMTSLREQVYNIIHNDLLRNNLIQKGLERAKNFSWENSAQQTLDVYKSVISL